MNTANGVYIIADPDGQMRFVEWTRNVEWRDFGDAQAHLRLGKGQTIVTGPLDPKVLAAGGVNADLLKALQDIANSPHCRYEANGSNQYGIGVTDGHRCAATTAQEAIDKAQHPAKDQPLATGSMINAELAAAAQLGLKWLDPVCDEDNADLRTEEGVALACKITAAAAKAKKAELEPK